MSLPSPKVSQREPLGSLLTALCPYSYNDAQDTCSSRAAWKKCRTLSVAMDYVRCFFHSYSFLWSLIEAPNRSPCSSWNDCANLRDDWCTAYILGKVWLTLRLPLMAAYWVLNVKRQRCRSLISAWYPYQFLSCHLSVSGRRGTSKTKSLRHYWWYMRRMPHLGRPCSWVLM